MSKADDNYIITFERDIFLYLHTDFMHFPTRFFFKALILYEKNIYTKINSLLTQETLIQEI